MASVAAKISGVQAALDVLARHHKVPGASLGILSEDERVEFATGISNRNTGVPVTTSTLFQIGSNTKVYTATLVMQLVDEKRVELDAPVRTYLPKLELADAKALPKITVRMLLTHTSGIEGDYFDEFGRGDDGIERYVDSFSRLGQIHEPGQMWSYCNSGWTLLGLLVEKLRGKPYHQVLRERILTPLGLDATTVLMEEMLAHSCAVGHIVPPGGNDPIVPSRVMMSPSHAPAGSMTASTPAEVLGFVKMHLDGGRAADGAQVLSSGSVKSMQQPQVKLPRLLPGTTEMGLGWILGEWDGERVIGHGGGTIGQTSFLQILPDRPLAVCLLTNSSGGGALWRDLGRYVFEEFAGVHVPGLPKLPQEPPKVDVSRYEGLYRRHGLELEFKAKTGHLVASVVATGIAAELEPPRQGTVRPIDAEIFSANISGTEAIAHFFDFDRRHRPRYVHIEGRVARRVEGAVAHTKATPRSKSKAKAPTSRARATRRRKQ